MNQGSFSHPRTKIPRRKRGANPLPRMRCFDRLAHTGATPQSPQRRGVQDDLDRPLKCNTPVCSARPAHPTMLHAHTPHWDDNETLDTTPTDNDNFWGKRTCFFMCDRRAFTHPRSQNIGCASQSKHVMHPAFLCRTNHRLWPPLHKYRWADAVSA